MRKFSLFLFALALFGGVAMAQDAGKLVKTGSKALSKYVADPENSAALDEARRAADNATKAEASLDKAWLLKGNAYAASVNTAGNKVSTIRSEAAAAQLIGGEGATDFSMINIPSEDAVVAIEAYQKAYETAEKAGNKKKAIEGMQVLSGSLSTLANAMLDAQKYPESYGPLSQMILIDDFYVSNNEAPLFAADSNRNQQKYIMAVVARQAGNDDDARRLHKELYDAKHNEAAVYAGYSQILMADGDDEGGLAVLTEGRNLFPENSDILFAEINYYIQKQDFATLETKLQEAIAREPDNVGLYNALGNVYMNLSQDSAEDGKKKEYQDKSVQYYNETLSRDGDNVDATYSIGSLYFNNAVKKAAEMNNLGTSKADQARYDQLNEEINMLFEQALPFFVKAEQMDPNDRNTLIALKEIYARQNDFEKSNEYKARIEGL